MPADQLDLTNLLKGQLSVTPEEHPDDRAARLEREKRDARLESYKGVATFCALLGSLISVAAVCVYVSVFDPNASADSKRWAQTVLSSLATGAASFVAGRKIGSK